ncbi:ubiquitin-conjugating enzyme E2 [Hugenholtzia roseola]|uniref:ubiquitin-conjugating enzyme E2 n=1 Tax=Hugenholtzia roseola TaxID=1002 RepID=UPI00041D00BF|nr:ubiquitin-conjugating enzyme E2 [Hugenholtzia roseola]
MTFTPQNIRNRRLSNDYREMENISGDMIEIVSVKGEVPYVEVYEIKIHVRSIISARPEYRQEHLLRISLPEGYPQTPPQIEMLSQPIVFHPNWFKNGRWCFGTWEMSETLGKHIIRMIRTLQYDTEITNEHSPAYDVATQWYVQNRHSGLFPCDTQLLPDPTKPKHEQPKSNRFRLGTNEADNPPTPPSSKPRFKIN